MKVKNITVILTGILILSLTAALMSSCSNDSEDAAIETTGATEEIQEYVDPYANVRFGEARDTLLFDVEWHTYDTYLEFIEEYKNSNIEYKESEAYMQLSAEDKKQRDVLLEENLKYWGGYSDKIKNGEWYSSKTINGKPMSNVLSIDSSYLYQRIDSEGYYIFEIYPYIPVVSYQDENGVQQSKNFGMDESNRLLVNSRYEYEDVLENEIIPYCDNLLAKGLITQEQYDRYTIDNPLDEFINAYFS